MLLVTQCMRQRQEVAICIWCYVAKRDNVLLEEGVVFCGSKGNRITRRSIMGQRFFIFLFYFFFVCFVHDVLPSSLKKLNVKK